MPDFNDARSLTAGTELTADICIVGAGAAGITLARTMAGKGVKILLMEGGGLEYEADSQRLYTGVNVGLKYYDLLTCRLRYFGGSTNHWGGFCLFSRESDFTEIKGVPLSGWPLSMSEVKDDLLWASDVIGHKPADFDPLEMVREAGEKPDVLIDPHTPSLETSVFSIGHKDYTRFGRRFRDELAQAADLQVFLHANLVKVQLAAEGNTVTHLDFRTLEGTNFKVRAKRYVLACHALENARQLLIANDVQKNGIGNESGYVGRCFQEHAHASSGILATNHQRFLKFYRADFKKPKMPLLTLRASALQEKGVLNYYCRLRRLSSLADLKRASKRLWAKRNERFDAEAAHEMMVVAENVDELFAQVYGRALHKATAYFLLDHRIEQAPNPDSRVVITDKRDSLGLPRLDLKWAINEQDVKTFEAGRSAVVNELSAAGIGRFVSEPITMEFLTKNVAGHWHHIGTARMSESASTGVVDKNLKVHSVDNLYVSGSAVYPRGGLHGPTMLIIALARRLGRHLLEQART